MTDMIPRAEADARVAAAYEAAANLHDETFCDKRATKAYWQSDAIRALTPDDARAALEAMLAEAEKRGEKRGMLRAAEIADTWTGLAAKSQGGTLTGGAIALAIRAEAEE
jgi:hypothetical protein